VSTLTVQPTGETVTFKEVPGSQEFSFSGNAFALRRTFQTRHSERFAFIRGMLGTARVVDKGALVPKIERFPAVGFTQLVDARPEGPQPFLYPVGVERSTGVAPTRTTTAGRSVGGVAGGRYNDPAVYSRAHTTLLYDAPTYKVLADDKCPRGTLRAKSPPAEPTLVTSLTAASAEESTYVYTGAGHRLEFHRYTTRITQPLTEAVRIPANCYHFVEGLFLGAAADYAPAPRQPFNSGAFTLVPGLEVTYVWHQVPALVQPWEDDSGWLYPDRSGVTGGRGTRPELVGACYTHVGTTNARWFDGFPPGTLLLTAVEARMYRWVDGTRMVDYTYRMKLHNPQDTFLSGASYPYTGPVSGAGHVQTRTTFTEFSPVGLNYFLRLSPPAKDGSTTVYIEPYWSLVTHNGLPLEQGGKPVIPYRDFEDLFIPYSRSHMCRYYRTATLTPLFDEAGT
jgi:hypothetical protein